MAAGEKSNCLVEDWMDETITESGILALIIWITFSFVRTFALGLVGLGWFVMSVIACRFGSLTPPLDDPEGVLWLAASGVDPEFESRPGALGVSESSCAVVLGCVTAADVSLKLMLNAPLPQSTCPPVKMNDRVPDGVELQLPPGI
jgi:hypothetical protein